MCVGRVQLLYLKMSVVHILLVYSPRFIKYPPLSPPSHSIYIDIYFIVIIILSCRQHRYPDPLSPPLPIIHCFRQVFRATPRICTKLLYVGSSWSHCLCSSMWRGPQEYITFELVPTTPAVSCMSGSPSFDNFCDGWSVAV